MTLMEVGLPSGFTVDESNLVDNKLIKRTENRYRQFVLYFDEIGNEAMCIKLRLTKTEVVGKLKGAFITLVDYYNPENSMSVPYASSMAQNSEVCELCAPNCKNCPIAKKR